MVHQEVKAFLENQDHLGEGDSLVCLVHRENQESRDLLGTSAQSQEILDPKEREDLMEMM